MLKHGFIYKWTNIENGKMYIGSHIGQYDDGYIGSGKYFKNSYNKNPNVFKREILISILSDNIKNDIKELEENLLFELNAADSEMYYNITNNYFGGDNFTGLNEIEKEKFKIKCKNNRNPPNDYDTWYKNVNMAKKKKCYQFDKDGNFIKEYDSLDMVCTLFKKNTKGNLASALKGKRNFWEKFRWSYTNVPNEIIIKNVGRKKGITDKKPREKRSVFTAITYKVHLINENHEIVKTFNSPTECSIYFNINKQILIKHLNGKITHVNYMKFIKGEKIKLIYNKTV